MLVSEFSHISCDSGGLLYGLVAHGELAGCIAVCDVRDKLVEQQQAPSLTLTEVQPCSILHPKPKLAFSATGLAAAPSGRYLAVSGYDHEDEDQAVVVVLDVHGAQPLSEADHSAEDKAHGATPGTTSRAGTAVVQSQASPASRRPPHLSPHRTRGVRHKLCMAHVVHYSLFASRPGLLIRQVVWHPHSDSHLLLLTSDSRARLYHVNSLQQAETTLHLQCSSSSTAASPGGGKYGLSAMAGGAGEEAMAVAWGSSTGWGPFTLYVLSSTGALYGVCPVTAVGMRCASSMLQQQLQHAGSSAAAGPECLAWLQAAFGVHDTHLLPTESWWTVRPHVVDGLSPALQGPLNAGCESLSAASAACTTLAALHHQQLPLTNTLASRLSPALLDTPLPPLTCTTALVCGRADGRLWAHLLLQPLGPCWSAAPPRVEYASGGHLLSVRYECQGAPAGSPADGAAVLLDAVDLQLRATSQRGSADSDDEEGLVAQPAGPLQLSLSPLSAAGSHMVLASHATGSWVVGIPWLAAAAQHLAAAEAGAGAGAELPLLPPPSVQQLLSCEAAAGPASGALLAACCVQDVFVGRVALLLQASGQLHCVRPGTVLSSATAAAAAELVPAAGSMPSASAPGVGKAGRTGAQAEARSGSPQARSKQAVDSAIQAVYGDLLAPPLTPPLPAAQGDLSAGAPQAAAYLSAAIRALRQGGVELAHRTHAGLMQRASLLGKEAVAHKASVQELRGVWERTQQRQSDLEARVARMVALHANLTERAALLTQLHWSLPRPMSEAEQQLSANLDVQAARQAALATRWAGLQHRADTTLQHLRPTSTQRVELVKPAVASASPTPRLSYGLNSPMTAAATVAAPNTTPGGGAGSAAQLRVPASQMSAVHAALCSHMAAISACGSELRRMQQQVKAYEEQAACSDVEAQLPLR